MLRKRTSIQNRIKTLIEATDIFEDYAEELIDMSKKSIHIEAPNDFLVHEEKIKIKSKSKLLANLLSGISANSFSMMWIVIVFILGYKICVNIVPRPSSNFVVDYITGNNFSIDFRLFFPYIPCAGLSMEHMNYLGIRSPLSDHLTKTRIDSRGNIIRIDQHSSNIIVHKERDGPGIIRLRSLNENSFTCLTCHGAFPEDQCCDNCNDLIFAYRLRNWDISSLSSTSQCNNSFNEQLKSFKQTKNRIGRVVDLKYLSDLKEQIKEGESCELSGAVVTEKLSGTLRFVINTFEFDSVNNESKKNNNNNKEKKKFIINNSHILKRLHFSPIQRDDTPSNIRTKMVMRDEKWNESTEDVIRHVMTQRDSDVSDVSYSVRVFPITDLIENTNAFSHSGMRSSYTHDNHSNNGVSIHYEVDPIRTIIRDGRFPISLIIFDCLAVVAGFFSLSLVLQNIKDELKYLYTKSKVSI